MAEPVTSHLVAPPEALAGLDGWWGSLRQQQMGSPQSAVEIRSEHLGAQDADVVVAGGTLGILVGAALAKRGWRVILLERGILRGREQEWNISGQELRVLLELELLTPAELEQVQVTHYRRGRIGFGQGPQWWVEDVLNVGVDPVALLRCLKNRFLEWGGQLLEQQVFVRATVHPDGVQVQTNRSRVGAQLLLDAMGHRSPLVAQARAGQPPDSVCLVVGSCAQGLPTLDHADLFYSFSAAQPSYQPFWEAFPARDGRTTYLFTYCDLDPRRPSLATLWQDYLNWLPHYQGVDLAEITWVRKLCGVFPAYRRSPLQLPWDRLLAIGDSSGSQSPLSFGGFAAMLRHLYRLQQGIHEALCQQQLHQGALALLQPYQPNLAVTWLFQKAMIPPLDQTGWDPHSIHRLLSTVFGAMFAAGPQVVKPFLQDVVQFGGLAQALWGVMRRDPWLVAQLLVQIGPLELAEWMGHFGALGMYSLLNRFAAWQSREGYFWQRRRQAWQYGSGGDYQGSLSA
ncbi:MAG: FAD-binding oxidoreductase [Cyanobacteriota bacterium]